MAYTINLTDGSVFATVADGTINTSSSMILVGKNYAGYGEFLDENFIHLLESGANPTAPGAPITGQLWWDKSAGTMKVYNGSVFKVISGATAAPLASPPPSPVAGDLWFDTTNQQLKVYNGSTFILIGPASTAGQGTSGAVVTTVTDNLSVDHVIVQLFVQNTIVGIISKDAQFTPQTGITGFTAINPGIQLSSTVTGALFHGNALNSQLLDNLDSTQFLRSDTNDSTTGTLAILTDSGMTVGNDQDFRVSVSTANSTVNIQNQSIDANIVLSVNDGGVATPVMIVNGATSQVNFPTTTGVTNIINLNANATGNIGSASSFFNRVFATSTTALYADVAERFAADNVYVPGTVVELGGSAEITESLHDLSDNVFGVVSTRAAYLMNAGAGTDETHPPVAMTGRVPVRVLGPISKGDRLVSAGNGLARSARPGEATAFNVIGRSLEDYAPIVQGIVEAIVTIK